MTAAGNARPSDVDRILADAATTLREGRVDEAIAKVRDGMAVHHDDARLGAQHAKLMMENGAFQAGFNQLKTLAQKSDAPLETLFLFGQSLQSAGRGNALERLFRRIERQAPHHPRLYVMRAVHFEKLGRWDEACRVAQEGLKHHPNSSGLITRLAHATAASGRGEDAIRLLENAPPKAATSLNVLSTLFDIYVSEHRVEDAGGVTKTLQGTFPDEPVTSLKSQEFLALTGDFEAALRCCDSGLATHPASVPLALAKVQRLKDLGRNSAAMDFLRGTIRGGIKAPQVRLALARLLQDAGELTKARAILAAFGRSPPIPAILAKASLLRVGGDIGAAAALLRSELEARPQERGIAVELVYALLEMGDVAAAEKVLRSNEALQEDTHSALLLEAAVCVAKGDLESAGASLAGVLAGPTPDENRLVNLLEQVGDVDGVKAVLARVEGRPPTVANLIKVARLSVLLEEDDQAVKALDRAAKIAGDAVEVRISKASVLSQMGYIFEATDTLKALPKDILADPSLRRVRAKCFWAVGEREAGLAALREAAASGDARSVYQLVRALVDLGRLDEARGEAGKVRQSNRTAASLVSLCRAVIALAALDLDRAAQHGQDAVDEDPSSAEALRILTSIEVTRLESARAWTALETLERHRKFRKVVASVALSRARLTIFGQMLNEFDLHPQVTERARDLLRAPPGDGVDGLKVEVAHEPGHTGVAIAYLIASRRAGRLAKTVDAMVTEGGSSIPRIVHQYWSDKELPPDVERAIAATRQGAGAAEHRLYDTAAVRSFLLRYHSTVVQRAFRLAMEPARRADIFRLAVLAAVGGVYVDADDLCLTYVDGFLPNGAGLVVGQERLGTIANNVIAAAPRHPVIVAALEEASEAMLHYSNESIWLATGPGLLTRHVAHYLATSADHGADVAVLTDVEMTRAFAMHMPMRHKKSSADWRRGGSGRTRRKTR